MNHENRKFYPVINIFLQETLQDLADKSGKFVVEYSRESFNRPLVVALPKSLNTPGTKEKLADMQLI